MKLYIYQDWPKFLYMIRTYIQLECIVYLIFSLTPSLFLSQTHIDTHMQPHIHTPGSCSDTFVSVCCLTVDWQIRLGTQEQLTHSPFLLATPCCQRKDGQLWKKNCSRKGHPCKGQLFPFSLRNPRCHYRISCMQGPGKVHWPRAGGHFFLSNCLSLLIVTRRLPLTMFVVL